MLNNNINNECIYKRNFEEVENRFLSDPDVNQTALAEQQVCRYCEKKTTNTCPRRKWLSAEELKVQLSTPADDFKQGCHEAFKTIGFIGGVRAASKTLTLNELNTCRGCLRLHDCPDFDDKGCINKVIQVGNKAVILNGSADVQLFNPFSTVDCYACSNMCPEKKHNRGCVKKQVLVACQEVSEWLAAKKLLVGLHDDVR